MTTTKSKASWSSGSSFARLLYRRRNSGRTLKRNQEAAKPLSAAIPAIDVDYKTSLHTSGPIIVEMSDPPAASTQKSDHISSVVTDPADAPPTSALEVSNSHTIYASDARRVSTTDQDTIKHAELVSFRDIPSIKRPQRPAYSRSRSSISSAMEIKQSSTRHRQQRSSSSYSKSSRTNSPAIFLTQSLGKPKGDIFTDRSDATMSSDSPLVTPGYLTIHTPDANITVSKRTSLLQGFWRRSGHVAGKISPLASPKLISSPKSTPTGPNARQHTEYFGSVLVESSSDDSSHTGPLLSPIAMGLYEVQKSPSLYSDVRGWLDRNDVGPEKKYIAADSKQYLTTRLTGPGSSSGLPSEMRRADTTALHSSATVRAQTRPPLSHARKSYTRGRNSDIPTPPIPFKLREDDDKVPLQFLVSKKSSHQDIFRQRVYAFETQEGFQPPDFGLDVTDHLPSSPLCPLNAKHYGGQKQLCPMHGRGKKV